MLLLFIVLYLKIWIKQFQLVKKNPCYENRLNFFLPIIRNKKTCYITLITYLLRYFSQYEKKIYRIPSVRPTDNSNWSWTERNDISKIKNNESEKPIYLFSLNNEISDFSFIHSFPLFALISISIGFYRRLNGTRPRWQKMRAVFFKGCIENIYVTVWRQDEGCWCI